MSTIAAPSPRTTQPSAYRQEHFGTFDRIETGLWKLQSLVGVLKAAHQEDIPAEALGTYALVMEDLIDQVAQGVEDL